MKSFRYEDMKTNDTSKTRRNISFISLFRTFSFSLDASEILWFKNFQCGRELARIIVQKILLVYQLQVLIKAAYSFQKFAFSLTAFFVVSVLKKLPGVGF